LYRSLADVGVLPFQFIERVGASSDQVVERPLPASILEAAVDGTVADEGVFCGHVLVLRRESYVASDRFTWSWART
jgi:hypothetical protein